MTGTLLHCSIFSTLTYYLCFGNDTTLNCDLQGYCDTRTAEPDPDLTQILDVLEISSCSKRVFSQTLTNWTYLTFNNICKTCSPVLHSLCFRIIISYCNLV